MVYGKVVEMRIIDYSKKQILDEKSAEAGFLKRCSGIIGLNTD
jgi:hypothetical protein